VLEECAAKADEGRTTRLQTPHITKSREEVAIVGRVEVRYMRSVSQSEKRRA
jgi:hypothetical protein